MYISKKLLIGSVLGVAAVISGCSSIPKEEHDQVLATQRADYEQKLESLSAENSATADKNKKLMAEKNSVESENTKSKIAKDSAESEIMPLQASQTMDDGSNQLFPPNAEPGHCYSRVLNPAVYKTNTSSVMVKPESEIISIIPTKYENGSERLLVKEATTKLIAIPATYKTVMKKVEVNPAHSHLETIPAVYETVIERVIDKPAHTVWKRGAGFQSSALETRIDNGTGEIMCLVDVPATYRNITKTVLKSAAQVIEKKHPATYKTVATLVVDNKATTQSVTIPAEYKTVAVKRMASPERQVAKKVDAVYKNVTSSEQVSAEELRWDEVWCESNMTPQTVSKLQKLLTKSGNYRGPIDGIYGPLTERAANGYSKTNGLPTGSRLISLETTKHIGLEI